MRLPFRGRPRILLISAVAVLVLVATGGVWLMTRSTSEAASSTTVTVSSQTIEQTVSADGTLAARRSADETFAVSGTVTRVAVKEGDRVRQGQVLATVGRSALVATRTAAVSSLNAAISQLDDDEDAGASDVQLAADKAAIVSARATLADARQAVADATLRASIAGTVTAVGLSAGDAVGSGSGSSGSGSGSSMAGAGSSSTTDSSTDSSGGTISIVSTGAYVVDATVAAADAKQLKKGLQAEITATGVDDTIYGTVSKVGLVAQTNSSGAAVFPVTIAVTGKQKDLYAGVSATASIVVKQIPDVLTVASNALSTEGGKTYVTKLVDGKEVRTEVETGETYGMTTEVTSGLEDGDKIVVQGFRIAGGGDRGGSDQQEGFPGGGQMPDFSQMGGGGGMPPGMGGGQ